LEHEDATDPNSIDQEPDPMAAAEKNHTNSMVIPGPREVPTRRSIFIYVSGMNFRESPQESLKHPDFVGPCYFQVTF